jgi:cytochrome P450
VWDGRRFGLVPGQDFDNLIDVRDKHIHATQRKAWNLAFSGSAVKDYQEILRRTGEELFSLLYKEATAPTSASGGPTVDIARWVSYFAYVLSG